MFDERHPDKPLRLVTSLLDVPARVVALPYRYRWQVELFFRWLKVHAHFAHLVSRSRNAPDPGVPRGRDRDAADLPAQRAADEQVRLQPAPARVAAGWGTLESALAVLARREAECARDRVTAAARAAARKRAAKTGA